MIRRISNSVFKDVEFEFLKPGDPLLPEGAEHHTGAVMLRQWKNNPSGGADRVIISWGATVHHRRPA